MNSETYKRHSSPPPDHVFCRHCCKINSLSLLPGPWYGPTIEDIMLSKSLCPLCSAIYASLEQSGSLEGDPNRRSVLRLVNDSGDSGVFWRPRHPFYTRKLGHEEELAILNGTTSDVASESIDIHELRKELDQAAFDITHSSKPLFSLIDCLGDAEGVTQPALTLNDFRKFHSNARFDLLAGLAIDVETTPNAGDFPEQAYHGFEALGSIFSDSQVSRMSTHMVGHSLLDGGPTRAARTWLQDCQRHHRFCHRSLEGEDFHLSEHPQPLPTRVIHLVADGSLRLLETKGLRGNFAALSYRQGRSTRDCLVLTKENRTNLLQQLPANELGRTINDAICVSRELRLQYLWVDVICIIQNDDRDFEREIASMARTYQFATVTIAVLGDRDSVSGFSGRPSRAPRVSIPWMQRLDDGSTFQTGDVPIHEHCTFDGLGAKGRLDAAITKSTWNSRAWTFQERLLSRRLLYFGESQLFWQCYMAVRSSYGYDDRFINPMSLEQLPLPLFWMLSRQRGFYRCLADCIEHGTTETHEFRHRAKIPLTIFRSSWLFNIENFVRKHLSVDVPGDSVDMTKLIYDYTLRDLAYPRDKLAAFEGLASVIAKRTRQNYVAGITTTHLAKSLFWCSEDGSMKLSTPLIAPSWSWASQEGAIRGFEIDFYDGLDRSEQYLRLVRDGNFAGNLKNVFFRQDNPALGTGRGVRPATLEAEALCLRCCLSSGKCTAYPELLAELEERVRIWPRWYEAWPAGACHFMHINCKRAGRSQTSIHGVHGGASEDTETLTENVMGVAYLDNPNDLPSTFEAILLWHSREPIQTVRDILEKHRNGERVLPLSATLRFAPFSMRTRRYFLLLVEPLNDIGAYRRIGIGIGFRLKEVDRVYGVDICKLSKRKKVVLI